MTAQIYRTPQLKHIAFSLISIAGINGTTTKEKQTFYCSTKTEFQMMAIASEYLISHLDS